MKPFTLRTPNAGRRMKARLAEIIANQGGQGLPTVKLGKSTAYPMGECIRLVDRRINRKPLPKAVDYAVVQALRAKIVQAASADTAYNNDYDPNICPLHNHCKAASYVVQQKLGGIILFAKVDGVGHYWNLLPCGTEVDLTGSQFDGINKGDGINPVAMATHAMPNKDKAKVNARFLLLEKRVNALV